MIGIIRVYGNYWCSPLREYLEEQKLPAELIDSHWVVLECKDQLQLEEASWKAVGPNDVFYNLGYKRHRKKFTRNELESIKESDVKYFKGVFSQQHKTYSKDFLRGYAFVNNKISESKTRSPFVSDIVFFRD